MIHSIGRALLGLTAGLTARALLPGQPGEGVATTALLGAAGGWLAAFAGERIGLYRPNEKAGLIMSILGAVALMLIHSLMLR